MFITNLNRLNRSRNAFEEIFNEILKEPEAYHWGRTNSSSNYKTDSDEDGVTLTINVPGYNDKLIDVSVSGDKLTIEGKAHSGDTDGFNYSFIINDNLDSDGIDATVIDGVLTVSIPYAEEVKPRKIKVKVK